MFLFLRRKATIEKMLDSGELAPERVIKIAERFTKLQYKGNNVDYKDRNRVCMAIKPLSYITGATTFLLNAIFIAKLVSQGRQLNEAVKIDLSLPFVTILLAGLITTCVGYEIPATKWVALKNKANAIKYGFDK